MSNEGISVEIEAGFAHIEFLDKSKRGETLAKLLAVGGPGLIDTDTSGARKTYIVPESIAEQAGLITPVAPAPEPAEPGYPEGAPEDSWTVPQLRAYATDEGIALGDATKKADILAALAAK